MCCVIYRPCVDGSIGIVGARTRTGSGESRAGRRARQWHATPSAHPHSRHRTDEHASGSRASSETGRNRPKQKQPELSLLQHQHAENSAQSGQVSNVCDCSGGLGQPPEQARELPAPHWLSSASNTLNDPAFLQVGIGGRALCLCAGCGRARLHARFRRCGLFTSGDLHGCGGTSSLRYRVQWHWRHAAQFSRASQLAGRVARCTLRGRVASALVGRLTLSRQANAHRV